MLLQLAQQSAGTGFAPLGGALIIILVIIGILASVFWLWMLVDALTSNKPAAEKILWVLVILFLHALGALIYFVAGRSPRPGTV